MQIISPIVPGLVFDTPFEAGCVALTAPDSMGCFDGLDSDGVLCAFTCPTIVPGAMPLTLVYCECDIRPSCPIHDKETT